MQEEANVSRESSVDQGLQPARSDATEVNCRAAWCGGKLSHRHLVSEILLWAVCESENKQKPSTFWLGLFVLVTFILLG